MDFKEELAAKAEKTGAAKKNDGIKLTTNMSIVDMIKTLEPEIRKALPSVLTPERFIRMALTAVNNTPALAQCTPMSFIAALMNVAQLGLEPNTPLGQPTSSFHFRVASNQVCCQSSGYCLCQPITSLMHW